jgi:hypothetical protein
MALDMMFWLLYLKKRAARGSRSESATGLRTKVRLGLEVHCKGNTCERSTQAKRSEWGNMAANGEWGQGAETLAPKPTTDEVYCNFGRRLRRGLAADRTLVTKIINYVIIA